MRTNSYVHLLPNERDRIAHLRAQGVSVNEIARQLRRDPSTISRELSRNKSSVYDVYLAHRAQTRAEERKSHAHCRLRLKYPRIRRYVVAKLKLGWSPESRCSGTGRLSLVHPELSISHEAIYQFVYDRDVRRDEDLVPHLVRAHKRRQQKGHSHTHRSLHIPERIAISERPQHVLTRRQFGHWETDAVIAGRSSAALNVSVERKSRLTHITKMPQRTARCTHRALLRSLSDYPRYARRTITYDNGSENVEHQRTNDVLDTHSYFCTPYHSWEKGTVENTVGLVRRVFRKKTNFDLVSTHEIKSLERQLNNRPRKCLHYQTPIEVFRSCVALKH